MFGSREWDPSGSLGGTGAETRDCGDASGSETRGIAADASGGRIATPSAVSQRSRDWRRSMFERALANAARVASSSSASTPFTAPSAVESTAVGGVARGPPPAAGGTQFRKCHKPVPEAAQRVARRRRLLAMRAELATELAQLEAEMAAAKRANAHRRQLGHQWAHRPSSEPTRRAFV